MSPRAWFPVAIVAIVLVFSVVVGRQWLHNQELRWAIDLSREKSREKSILQAQNRRLKSLQPSDTELSRLRADRGELVRLQSLVEKAKTSADQIEHKGSSSDAEPALALIPTGSWQDHGRASPSAAVESIFWASARADIASLSKAVILDEETQSRFESLWRQLPPATRESYGSTAGMLASLLAQDGATVAFMGIVNERQPDADTAVIKTRVENNAHQGKTEDLELHRTEDGWRLSLPPRALARYEAAVKAQIAVSNSSP